MFIGVISAVWLMLSSQLNVGIRPCLVESSTWWGPSLNCLHFHHTICSHMIPGPYTSSSHLNFQLSASIGLSHSAQLLTFPYMPTFVKPVCCPYMRAQNSQLIQFFCFLRAGVFCVI
ncbi:hypothetical protein AVEN_79590-1 [Araneus ventricosus]|uniref:Secreted protein n=1 Tax=Araneus ventricosus TaxID=182803 RepID=A0A4Y2QLR6_ARAVE|nr:hypothetical protein AVEN_180280-1 [Araneus ventricosus]GBN64474.1 hypothetical protein AVEN_79590-1 [Araneus ventricosus]